MDLASLGFNIDTSQVREANKDLDGLTGAATGLERAASRVEKSFSDIGAAAGKLANGASTAAGVIDGIAKSAARNSTAGDKLVQSLQQQINLYGKSSDEVLRYIAAQNGVLAIVDAQIAKLNQLSAAEAERNAAAARSANVTKQIEASQAQLVAEQDKFLAGLHRQIETSNQSAIALMKLDAAVLGLTEEARPLIAVIENITKAQADMAVSAELASKQESFAASLKRQIDTYGMGAAEIRRYTAAQLGLTSTLASELDQIDKLEQAQSRKNAAVKASADITRQVAATDANLERQQAALIAGLEKEIALYGKDALAAKEYQAALLGISGQAGVLITKLRELENAKASQAQADSIQKGNNAGLREAVTEYNRMQSATASFVDSLKSKIDLFGQDEIATLRYKASLQGISAIVEPLIAKYEALNAARNAKISNDADVARINAMNEALTRQIALFGKSETEIQLYKAAEIGAGQTTVDLINQLKQLNEQKHADAAASAAASKAQKELATAQEQLIGGLRKQISAFADDTLEAKRYEAALLGVSHVVNPLIAEIQQYQEVKRAQTQATKDQAFLDGLEQEVALLGKDRFAILELQAAKRGLTNESKAYIQALRDADQASRNGMGMGAANLSARQLSQALRLLPAQITDVVTSLASGMPAWLVFVQQGGQIKDSFGGASNAIKILLNFLTPARVAIGAVSAVVGVLAAGFVVGNLEADKFKETLALVGKGLGVDAAAATDMAHAIASSTGSIANATDVLNEFMATGAFTTDTLQKIAQAAVDLERYAGKSVSSTVAEFSQLAKDPVAASLKLNETYHYLTASVYEQIRALKTQGDTVAAANLAETTYANAMQTRSNELKENLGVVKTAWLALGDAAKGAWDAMLDVGREKTPEQKISQLTQQIAMIRARQGQNQWQGISFGSAGDNAQLQLLEQQLTDERVLLNEQQRRNQLAKNTVQIQGLAVIAAKEIADWEEKGLSAAEKRERATTILNKRVAEYRAAGNKITEDEVKAAQKGIELTYKDIDAKKQGLTAGQRALENARENNAVLQAQVGTTETLGTAQKALIEYNVKIANIKKKDIKTADEQSLLVTESATRAVLEQSAATEKQIQKQRQLSTMTVSSAQKTLEAAQQRSKVLEQESSSGVKLLSDAQALVKFNEEIANIKNKKVLTADEKQLLAMEGQVRSVLEHNAQLGKTVEQQQQLAKFTERVAQIEATAATNRQNRLETYQRSLEGMGMGDIEAERLKAENDLRREYTKAQQQINNASAKGTMNSDAYNTATANNRAALDQQLKDLQNYYDQVDAAQSNWKNGAKKAFDNYVNEGRNAANLVGNVFSTALNGMTDSLAAFVTTGKADFKGLMTSILSELAKAELKMAASSIFSALGGLAGIGLSLGIGGLTGAAGVTSDGWANNTAYLASAKGNVFESSSLHDYVNSIVNSPTTFKFAKGSNAIMGEAGPEAVMPLVRGADGNLGVRTSGASGGVSVNVVINGSNGDTSTSSTTGYEKFGNEIGAMIEQKYRQLLSRDLKQGGAIRSALGRS